MSTYTDTDAAPRAANPPDLRARKRARTMLHIQRVALDLFDQRGFAAVTIADIAAVAEVGERSVYRYFGTKHDILLYDEIDEMFVARFAERVREVSPVDAVRQTLDEAATMFTTDYAADAERKLRVLNSTRELRAAVAGYTTDLGDQVGRAIAEARSAPPDDLVAHIQGRCIVTALAAAVDRWYHTGGATPALDLLHHALDGLAAGFGGSATAGNSPSGPDAPDVQA